MIDRLGNILEKKWGMLLLIAVPIFFVLSPVLIGGKVFFGEDVYGAEYPYLVFFHNALRAGESVLWNPLVGSGFPIFVSLGGGFFSPVNYIMFRFLPVLDAYHWLIFLYYVLGAYFVALLLKDFKASAPAALIGAFVYAFGLWKYAADLTIVSALPLLPFLFWMLWRFKQEKKFLYLFFGGIAVGVNIFSAHYHYLIEILFAVFLFSLFLFADEVGLWWKRALKGMWPFLVISGIGGLIALPQIIPVLVYAGLSGRAGGLTFAQAGSEGALKLADVFRLFSPYFNLGPFFHGSGEWMYIGILPLVFLILGISFRGSFLRKLFTWFFFLMVGLALPFLPLFFLLHQLPVLNYIRSPGRWLFVAVFAAAVLAGFGVDEFIKIQADNRRIKYFWNVLLIFAIIIIVPLVLMWVGVFFFEKNILSFLTGYFDRVIYSSGSFGLPLSHYHNYIVKVFNDNKQQVDLLNPRVLFPVGFFVFCLWFMRRFFYGLRDRMYGVELAVLIVALNFIFVFFFFHPLASRTVFESDGGISVFIKSYNKEAVLSGFASSERIVSILPAQSEFFKLSLPYGVNPPSDVSLVFQNTLMPPNANIRYSISSVYFFDNFMSRRTSRVIAYLGSATAPVGEQLAYEDITPEEKIKILQTRKSILDFVGARYIVSAYPFDEKKFSKVFTTETTSLHIPISVYENKNVHPLFYFADAVEVIPENEILAFEKLKTLPEQGKNVFIECPRDNFQFSIFNFQDLCGDSGIIVNGKGTIEIQIKKNVLSVIKTKSNALQLLVFSENNLPGWKAYVDGAETSLYTVGSVYMGVLVLAGEHEVRFEFTYRSILEEFWKMLMKKVSG